MAMIKEMRERKEVRVLGVGGNDRQGPMDSG